MTQPNAPISTATKNEWVSGRAGGEQAGAEALEQPAGEPEREARPDRRVAVA